MKPVETILPFKNKQANKTEQIAEMFDGIAPRYDFLNRFLSLGIDTYWRKKMIKLLPQNCQKVLDVATGTADVALEIQKQRQPQQIVGIDISEKMLEIGQKKVQKYPNILLQLADAQNLPFQNNIFDAITVSFGVRNFENIENGLAELHRTLKKDGKLIVLEFSQPTAFPIKQFYRLYANHLLPQIGKLVSKHHTAYGYLPESVAHCPYGNQFLEILNKIGFKSTQCTPLTFGICSLYTGIKL